MTHLIFQTNRYLILFDKHTQYEIPFVTCIPEYNSAMASNTSINTETITPGNYVLLLKNELNTLSLIITKE